MPKIILLLCLFPICLFAQQKTGNVILSDRISIRLEESTKTQFLKDLNSFLLLKDTDLSTSNLIDPSNYLNYKDIFDELKFIELNAELQDSNYYKPHLINFVKQAENTFLVSLSFIGNHEKVIEEKAKVTLLVKQINNSFQFLNPFEFYTSNWNTKQLKDVEFHYKGAINEEEALSFATHNEYLASLFRIVPYRMHYYNCRDLQEVYQLLGVDYHIDINGMKRGCVTLSSANFFISGTNKDEYNHDLTHYYFGLQLPSTARNWVAEEGFNINRTDYWGFSTEDNYTFLREFLAQNDATPLEIFEKNRIMKSPIPTKMPVAAVIMRKIERENGMAGVMQVIASGTTDEDFFRAIKEVAQISKRNFNKVVIKELKRK